MPKIEQHSFFPSTEQSIKKSNEKKDFFEKFDKPTQLKLEILEVYFKAWLPVFLSQKYIKNINIFDFFSGKGKDSKGVKGSPLRILDTIKNFDLPSNAKINVYFNDYDLEVCNDLKNAVDSYDKGLNINKIEISNQSFEVCFNNHYSLMSEYGCANFLWLDPFGMVTTDTIQRIIKLHKTDFLLFIPLDHIRRFINQESIQKIYKDIEKESFPNIKTAHRNLKEYFKKQCGKEYYLHTFAIEKEAKSKNKYCLLFGSQHPLGLYKFIHECWKLDPKNGEANFTFSGDEYANFLDENYTHGSAKVRDFQERLYEAISQKRLKTNKDIFHFVLESGFHPPSKHVKQVLEDLQKAGIIENKKFPLNSTAILNGKNIADIPFCC